MTTADHCGHIPEFQQAFILSGHFCGSYIFQIHFFQNTLMWYELLSKAGMLPCSDMCMLCNGKINIELGDIMILSFIMIFNCHDNLYQREILSIITLSYRNIINIITYCIVKS